jgi:hypothetical protein
MQILGVIVKFLCFDLIVGSRSCVFLLIGKNLHLSLTYTHTFFFFFFFMSIYTHILVKGKFKLQEV